jgi:hypothetical protein
MRLTKEFPNILPIRFKTWLSFYNDIKKHINESVDEKEVVLDYKYTVMHGKDIHVYTGTIEFLKAKCFDELQESLLKDIDQIKQRMEICPSTEAGRLLLEFLTDKIKGEI